MTLAFAGVVFATVVGLATVAALLARRSEARRTSCASPAPAGAVPVEVGPTRRTDAG